MKMMYCDSWYVFFGVNNSVKERKLKSYPFGQSHSFGFANKPCPPPELRKVYTQMIGVCKLVKAGDQTHGTQSELGKFIVAIACSLIHVLSGVKPPNINHVPDTSGYFSVLCTKLLIMRCGFLENSKILQATVYL